MTEPVAETVNDADQGSRLDAFLAARLGGISRTLIQETIRGGRIVVNGSQVRPSHRLFSGDRVTGEIDEPEMISAAPESIPLIIVYQDDDIAVIDKPAGLVVHPAAGHPGGTVANALAALFPSAQHVGSERRPGIVHRLDKDTSGLMAVALSRRGYASLQQQITSRTAKRRYLALVTGRPLPAAGRIEAPIGRDPLDRRRMAAYGVASRPAQTSYRVIEDLRDFSLTEASLHTGRTHQIRVHLSSFGHPIAGDSTYHGRDLPSLRRQFLHAYRLAVESPATGRVIQLTSELPRDLATVLEDLRTLTRARDAINPRP